MRRDEQRPAEVGPRPVRRRSRRRPSRAASGPRRARHPAAGGPAARRAARRDHRGAGGPGGLRARRGDRLARSRPGAAERDERVAFDVAGRREHARGRRSRVRAVLPARSTSPRRAIACGARRAGHGRPRGASEGARSARRSAAPAAPSGREALDARPDRAGAHRAPHGGETPDRPASRCAGSPALLERLDDPRLTPSADRDLRRQLREEIALLWQTAELRRGAPTPARRGPDRDGRRSTRRSTASRRGSTGSSTRSCPARAARESGSSSAADAGVPALRARGSAAIATATRPSPRRSPRRRSGSTPTTSSAATRRSRPGSSQTLAAKVRGDAVPAALAHRLAEDEMAMPGPRSNRSRERFPDEPFRQRFGFIAERLRHTRARLLGERRGATTPALRGARRAARRARARSRRRSSTSGSRDRRGATSRTSSGRSRRSGSTSRPSRSGSTRRSIARRARGRGRRPARRRGRGERRARRRGRRDVPRHPARAGGSARPRSRATIVSFTPSGRRRHRRPRPRGARRAATRRRPRRRPAVRVVRRARERRARSSTRSSPIRAIATHLRARGDRQEVMLGYSDSNKESGYRRRELAAPPGPGRSRRRGRRHGIELTLFHGRGGAIGRGGGQLELARRRAAARARSSGRLKVTEQGEVDLDPLRRPRARAPSTSRRSPRRPSTRSPRHAETPRARSDGGRADPGRARRHGGAARLSRAGRTTTRVPGVLRPDDADRRDRDAPARLATSRRGSRARAGAGRTPTATPRRPPRDPVGLRLVPGAGGAAGLVRPRGRAGGVGAAARRGGDAAPPRAPRRGGRSSARSLDHAALAIDRPTWPSPGATRPSPRSPATPSAGRRSSRSTSARSGCWSGCSAMRGWIARDRRGSGRRTWTRCPPRSSACSRSSGGARRDDPADPEVEHLRGLVTVDDQRPRGGAPGDGLGHAAAQYSVGNRAWSVGTRFFGRRRADRLQQRLRRRELELVGVEVALDRVPVRRRPDRRSQAVELVRALDVDRLVVAGRSCSR